MREWYNTMHMRVKESKTRVMKTTEQFWTKKTVTGSDNMEAWRVASERIGTRYKYTEDRPNSVASMDRRRSRGGKPRSTSADHSRRRNAENDMREVNQLRNAMLSDDSGNSSLSTYTSDSRKCVNKDGRRSEGEGGNKYRGQGNNSTDSF